MLVAHRLQGVGSVGGVRAVGVGVGDDAGGEPDDAAGYAQRGGGGGAPCSAPQRGQQDVPDLDQGEGVRVRVPVTALEGGDGEGDVLGEPQQQEGQRRVGVRAAGT